MRLAAARSRLGTALEIDPHSAYAITQLARIDVEANGDLDAAEARLSGIPLENLIAKPFRWWLAMARGDTAQALALADVGDSFDSAA